MEDDDEKGGDKGGGDSPQYDVRGVTAPRARLLPRRAASERGGLPARPPVGAPRGVAPTPTPAPFPSCPRAPRPPLQKEVSKIKDFLETFQLKHAGSQQGPLKYLHAIAEIKNRSRRVLDVELDDVAAVMERDFLANVEGNTMRYMELFYKAVDSILLGERKEVDVIDEDDTAEGMMNAHRMRQLLDIKRDEGEELDAESARRAAMFPAALLRAYELHIVPRTLEKPLSLRQVAGSSLGRLVQIKAMVLRATDVRPMMEVASYSWCGRRQPSRPPTPPARARASDPPARARPPPPPPPLLRAATSAATRFSKPSLGAPLCPSRRAPRAFAWPTSPWGACTCPPSAASG
jgi:hypothetical protein